MRKFNPNGPRRAGLTTELYQSIGCSNCRMALKTDEFGIPPDEIRWAVIQSKGHWGVNVEIDESERLSVWKVLNGNLNTSLEEVKQMKQHMPGILYTGDDYKNEMAPRPIECTWIQVFGLGADRKRGHAIARYCTNTNAVPVSVKR